jgi:hypothetical protein
MWYKKENRPDETFGERGESESPHVYRLHIQVRSENTFLALYECAAFVERAILPVAMQEGHVNRGGYADRGEARRRVEHCPASS